MLEIGKNTIKISVIGGSRISEGSNMYDTAYQVGKLIARNSAILVCGGLAGVMEAACRGAKDEKGLTIGILPSADSSDANPWIDISIPTGLGYARNALVVLSADSIIAIDGAEGTLTEIGYALTYQKPLICFDSWELKACSSAKQPHMLKAKTPWEAVSLAVEAACSHNERG